MKIQNPDLKVKEAIQILQNALIEKIEYEQNNILEIKPVVYRKDEIYKFDNNF